MTADEILALAPRIASKSLPRPSYYSTEDVQQDACVILLQQEYDPECGVPEVAWRFRDCLTRLRDYLKHKTRFESEYTDAANPVTDAPADHRLDVHAALDAVGLTPHEKATLLARYEDGLTQEEIAARFGCGQQAVHQTLVIAQEKLRGYFDEDYLRPRPVQPADGRRQRRSMSRRGALAVASGV